MFGTAVAGCTAGTAAAAKSPASGTTTGSGSGSGAAGTAIAVKDTTATGTMFDAGSMHTIAIEVDQAALKKALQAYVDSSDKQWVTAGVTIDGTTFAKVGMKLKGNSSLRGVSANSDPQTLPWRVRLDKYVDGQNLGGYTDFTVRANSSQTSLNEAVALDLLRDAGLASEAAVQTRFSVNGSKQALRLTVQNLNEDWAEENFTSAGKDSVLYKAEGDGNWSWQGESADYSSSFDIEAGQEDDYTPLIALLDLLNNGTAQEIADRLPTMLDIDTFAKYLAFEDLIDNFDDIDGPGNNSYLFWDSATKKFTVVAWDHNLAFGSGPGMGQGGQGGAGMGQGGQGGMGQPPSGMAVPTGAPGGQGGPGQDDGQNSTQNSSPNGQGGNQNGGRNGGGRPGGGDNPLVKVFKANSDWLALYNSATTDLKAQLFTSGLLTQSLDKWVSVLTSGASDLVTSATITSEADAIRKYATS